MTMISLNFISSQYQVPHKIMNIFYASKIPSMPLEFPQLHSSAFCLFLKEENLMTVHWMTESHY